MKILSALFNLCKHTKKIHISQCGPKIIFKFGIFNKMEYVYDTIDETFCKRGDFEGGIYFSYISFPRDIPLHEYFKNKVLNNTMSYKHIKGLK